jgi:uncharacterized protein (TIGR03790 family)
MMKCIGSIALVILLVSVSSVTLYPESESLKPSPDPESESSTVISEESTSGLYGGLFKYDDVALIVNDNSEISREIGTYFANRRGIPSSNIINISVPAQETINQGQFDDLADQVRENLSKRELTDSIEYLVTTKGVPLRVSASGGRAASVDSELMLLDGRYENRIHSGGFFLNPYYQDVEETSSMKPFSREAYDIRLVTRLTGYTKEEAMRLVDLSENSFGSRGRALLDMDPRKGMGSSGYGMGNQWMYDANTWLSENNWETHLDNNNTFITDWNETMAYFSWGSNDGNWGRSQMSNTGFESGSETQPSSWIIDDTGGSVKKDNDTYESGSWSLNITRNTTGILKAYQEIDMAYPDHRIIADGRMDLEGVTSPGARILIEGLDGNGIGVWSHELANRTGTIPWSSYQDPIENDTRVKKIRYTVELLGEGTVHFDTTNIRVIRPRNQWVPGAIAETCVSTGGRSQTYGTWYGQSLIADLIRDGVTGVKGYAFEPYLSAISHADILFPAYYSGFNLAESFWMGSQMASWMGYVVGDPKCAPFINERPDLGFIEDEPPIITSTDDEGNSFISFRLFNKGNTDIINGDVEITMDDYLLLLEGNFDIKAGETVVINISTIEEELIQGTHQFKVLLDSENRILEFDESNNILISNLTVNSEPGIEIQPEDSVIMRTEELNISVSVTDGDMDFGKGKLEIVVMDPSGREYSPHMDEIVIEGENAGYRYLFTPPWNATLGFYSIRGTFTDLNGSSITDHIMAEFKVLNTPPTLDLNLSSREIGRGHSFTVNMTWNDPDTPDGDLETQITARNSRGRIIESVSYNTTSSNTGQAVFTLPEEENSGDWLIEGKVIDRDGAQASGSQSLSSFNLPPDLILVRGGGQNITRLEETEFTIRYTDPEGLPSEKASIFIMGPTNLGLTETVFMENLDMQDGKDHSITIQGKSMAIGTYMLRVDYQDDENAAGFLEVDSIFSIIPVSPNISRPAVTYDGKSIENGSTVVRGGTIHFRIDVLDPDGTGFPPKIEAHLTTPTGERKDIYFTSKGSREFMAILNTDGSWEVGSYSITITASDSDGVNSTLLEENIFILDADFPALDQGKIQLKPDGNVLVEVSIEVLPSSSIPVSVSIHIADENGTELGVLELQEGSGFGLWMGEGDIEGIPHSGSLFITDDTGRSFWLNETLEIEIEKVPGDVTDDPRKNENDDTNNTLILLISVALIILLLLLVVLLVVISKKKKRYVPAPPITGPVSSPPIDGGRNTNSLPERIVGTTSLPRKEIDALPPGNVLEHGGSYHRPPVIEEQGSKMEIIVQENGVREGELLETSVDSISLDKQIPQAPEPKDMSLEKNGSPPIIDKV